MQIEIYKMTADNDSLTITLEAICDSFSSLIWDIEYYRCGQFEVYIAASPRNIEIFQTGRIVGRDDDSQHFGIIESVQIDTDIENGDYITVIPVQHSQPAHIFSPQFGCVVTLPFGPIPAIVDSPISVNRYFCLQSAYSQVLKLNRFALPLVQGTYTRKNQAEKKIKRV